MKHIFIFLFLFSSNFTFSQTVCDSVEIVLVNVDAFTSNQLNLRVVNSNTQEIFSYPGFRVYDENDNLIGEEEVFFFGIGGESTHSVLFDESSFPFITGQNYGLRIELWKNFYDEMVCEFEVTFQILPQVIDCVDIQLTLSEFSQDEVTYSIELTDYSGNLIHSEILIFSPTVGAITRNFCLPPSCFYLTVSSEQASEVSNVLMSLVASDIYGFYTEQILEQEVENTILFSIWQDCSLINSISEIDKDKRLNIHPNPSNDIIHLSLESDTHSNVELFNSLGQTIMRLENVIAQDAIDVSHLLSGLYLITVEQNSGSKTGKFIKL